MDVLHADDSILVLNKPAGLPVLPDGWATDAPYLVRTLEQEYGTIWVVHRLDKVTSGVMVFGRTAEAHRALSVQFEHHEARKIYHGILVGAVDWEEKLARHPLRVNVGHKHRTAVDTRHGKASETRFSVLARYVAYTFVQAELMTGRTHQIRAHAYALGHPLLGDVLYSAPETELIDRPALHAFSLSFAHPQTMQQMAFTALYPRDFEKALEAVKG